MSKKVRLTMNLIRELKCPEGKSYGYLWDDMVPGLGVRATPKGLKTYIVQARLAGEVIREPIGSVNTWNLDSPAKAPLSERQKSARFEASRILMLIDQGIDPRVAKAEKLSESRTKRLALEEAKTYGEKRELTFGEVWSDYIASNSSRWGHLHKRDHAKVIQAPLEESGKRLMPGALYPLINVPIKSITTAVVKEWLCNENAVCRPTQTRLSFRLFRAFYNWCVESDKYQPLMTEGVFRKLELQRLLPKKAVKDDFLELSQLPVWFDAVRKISSTSISAYLQILVLTGARREELAKLTWDNVDFVWHTLRIDDKVVKSRDIPLTPYVESLLIQLKNSNETPPPSFRISTGRRIANDLENWKPSPWVFSSKTSASGRLMDASKAHREAARAVGLKKITIHGLRRTFATHSDDIKLSIPAGVVAQIMGHSPSATAELHYKRRPLDMLREWHTMIEAFLLSAAGIGFTSK